MPGVSVSGYYDWRGHEPSHHEREDGEISQEIHRIFHAHREVYGSPRIQVELVAKRQRNKPIGTKQRKDAQVAPNLLNRAFSTPPLTQNG
ncbi:MAG TPA: hypothetical protein VFU49_02785 [Ktedonobacteraceae bacterium]|nr:hypothetical protein [Ktedonobacteraceae bacterium]